MDTPGHFDYTAEVERSVRVLDGAIAVIDAVAGVQAQTETVWRQANRYGVARVAFVNKYDKEGASLDFVMKSMRQRLGCVPLALQRPIGEGVGFRGVMDLIRMQALEWPESDGKRVHVRDLEPGELEEAKKGRAELLESICEVDDTFLEAFLSNPEKCQEVQFIHAAIRRATISMRGVPCVVGSAFRNKGVQGIMDSIVLYLPSPQDVASPPEASVVTPDKDSSNEKTKQIGLKPDDKGELVCLAWKVIHDHRMGLITYFRVLSGVLQTGKMLINTSMEGATKERLTKLVLLKGQDMEIVPQITAGHIGAIVGLKQVSTGDTLMEASTKRPLRLRRIDIPPPVFFRAIEPQSLADQDKLEACLELLHKEDPSFQISVDAETGQTLVGGMGELHLEYILDRLVKHYNVQGVVGEIMIAYRCAPLVQSETLVEEECTYDGGNGKTVRGSVTMRLFAHPLEDASSYVRIEDGRWVEWGEDMEKRTTRDKKALHAILEGIEAGCNRGNSRGYPLVNIGAEVLAWNVEGDSSGAGDWGTVLRVCAERALRSVWHDDEQFAVLEPAMTVEVRVENDFFGPVGADLTSARRGVISEVRVEGREKVAMATVPLKEMIGYSSQFRQRTGGRGSYSMEFQKYVVTRQKL